MNKKTFKEILKESSTKKDPYDYLKGYGFIEQDLPVVDGHISYLRFDDVILIDTPAKEWHFMEDGVVVDVGSTEDDSLENYLKNR